jgi:hypothetical protein
VSEYPEERGSDLWTPGYRAARQRTLGALRFACEYARPATESEVRECEASLTLALPPDYRAFLKRSNGAFCSIDFEIAPGLRDSRILTLLGTDLLPEINTLELRDKMQATTLFAMIMDGDRCGFVYDDAAPDQYTVRYFDHDRWPEWPVGAPTLAGSFSEFLRKCFVSVADGRDFEYWNSAPLPWERADTGE